jgi:adenosylhomocysteine nucleosidase
MLKILITCAVREEFFEIKWPDTEVYYVLTGIGKAKAAYRVAEAINHVQPDLVVNAGTAGTIVHQVGDIFVCKTFVDRDMAKLKDFGLESEISTTELLPVYNTFARMG